MTERLTALLSKTEKDGNCLIWQGKIKKGLCEAKWKGKRMSVQKLIVMLSQNVVPKTVHKICDNTTCVNPEHFYYDTLGDNSKLMQTCPICMEPYPYIPSSTRCPTCNHSVKSLQRKSVVPSKRLIHRDRKYLEGMKPHFDSIARKLHSNEFYAEYELRKELGQTVESYRDQKRKELVALCHARKCICLKGLI